MQSLDIYTRLRKSDFIDNTDSNNNFDEGAWEHYVLAYREVLKFIRQQSNKHPELDWKSARQHLRPALYYASKNFWTDHDYDERFKAVHVKEEAKTILKPLENTIAALKDLSAPFQAVIDLEAQKKLPEDLQNIKNICFTAFILNEAISQACQSYVNDKYVKEGSKKFYRSCRDLVAIWEKITSRPFSPTLRFIREVNREKIKNNLTAKTAFDSIDAQFVFVAIYAISRRQAAPTQIETTLNIILKK